MAQIFAVVSLGILLAATALVWRSWERTDAGVDPASLSISEIMAKIDAKSLPAQQIEDQSIVFPARIAKK